MHRSIQETVSAPARFLAEQNVEAVPIEGFQVPGSVSPRPVVLLVVPLLDPVDEFRLIDLRGNVSEARPPILTEVETEVRFDRKRRQDVVACERVAERRVVLGDVISLPPSLLKRIRLVGICYSAWTRVISRHVEHGHHRLHQNVFSKHSVFAVRVVKSAAAAILTTQRQDGVFTETELATVERSVGAEASSPVVGVCGCPLLIEVVARHRIGVGIAAAPDVDVVIIDWSRAPHGLPPVRAGAAGLDQAVRVGVLGEIDLCRPAVYIPGKNRVRRRVRVQRYRRIIWISPDRPECRR